MSEVMSERIVVVSPHPDDDAIGCGGTLIQCRRNGQPVYSICLTSGEAGGHGRSHDDTILLREAEATSSAQVLEIEAVEFWRQPDGALQVVENNIVRLAHRLRSLRPRVLYVTHELESHPDHRAAAHLVRAAVTMLEPHTRPEVLMYEVWTPIQQLDAVVNISAFVEQKRRAIRAHMSQCEHVEFDEAILGLNRYRGEMHCWPEGEYAEVFEKMRFDPPHLRRTQPVGSRLGTE